MASAKEIRDLATTLGLAVNCYEETYEHEGPETIYTFTKNGRSLATTADRYAMNWLQQYQLEQQVKNRPPSETTVQELAKDMGLWVSWDYKDNGCPVGLVHDGITYTFFEKKNKIASCSERDVLKWLEAYGHLRRLSSAQPFSRPEPDLTGLQNVSWDQLHDVVERQFDKLCKQHEEKLVFFERLLGITKQNSELPPPSAPPTPTLAPSKPEPKISEPAATSFMLSKEEERYKELAEAMEVYLKISGSPGSRKYEFFPGRAFLWKPVVENPETWLAEYYAFLKEIRRDPVLPVPKEIKELAESLELSVEICFKDKRLFCVFTDLSPRTHSVYESFAMEFLNQWKLARKASDAPSDLPLEQKSEISPQLLRLTKDAGLEVELITTSDKIHYPFLRFTKAGKEVVLCELESTAFTWLDGYLNGFRSAQHEYFCGSGR